MLYKHNCGLYVEPSNCWYLQHYMHDSFGKGDIIYHTMRKIIDDNDKSVWAYNAFSICASLLFERKRWPDQFNHTNDAKTWIGYRLSKLRWDTWYMFNKPKPGHRLYRTQTCMTRDPYIYFYACAMHLNRKQFIKAVTIPIYLFRLKTWLWRGALIKGKRSRLYEWLERTDYDVEYAQLLKDYRVDAYCDLFGFRLNKNKTFNTGGM